MKVVLATSGSRGDVQPALALGLALQRAGHNFLLAGPPEQKDRVEGLGISFKPLGRDHTAFIKTMPDTYTLRAVPVMTAFIKEEIRLQLEQLPDLLAGADLALGVSLALASPSVAEAAGVPFRFVSFCPQIFPSAAHPPMVLKKHSLPRWVNRLAWTAFRRLDLMGLDKTINQGRTRLGLKPIQDPFDYLLGQGAILAADPELGKPPPDVEYEFRQTGYWHLETDEQLPPDLEDFLKAGPPPVFAGFGSMPSTKPETLAKLLIDAARSAGQRIILSRGWAGLGSDIQEKDVYVAGNLPHLKLFPHVSAVIHHGGAGTTATAARCGAPQVLVPQVLDQFYWARRVREIGLGPKPISRGRLTVRNLSEALSEIANQAECRLKAAEMADSLKNSPGFDSVIELLEEEAAKGPAARQD